ncbi:MAG: ABC transporter substrate-binding protein [Deltaproteobacteria bacterium]|jgi:iron complex transport system substrate-binding protein|nr:ABC transporter substrate-binding protein [Deltaproteobacteria bacterium]
MADINTENPKKIPGHAQQEAGNNQPQTQETEAPKVEPRLSTEALLEMSQSISTTKGQRRLISVLVVSSVVLILVALAATILLTTRTKDVLVPGKDFYAIIPEEGYLLSLDAVGKRLALIKPGDPSPKGFKPREIVEIPVDRLVVGTGQFDGGLAISLGMAPAIKGVTIPDTAWLDPVIDEGLSDGSIVFLGTDTAMDYERIVALEPDLVFAPNMESMAVFEELNLAAARTYTVLDNSLNARFAFVQWLGVIGGKEAEAAAFKEKVTTTLAELEAKVQGLPEVPTVWALIFEKRVFVEPGQNWVGEVVKMLGGRYVFEDVPGDSTIEVTLERFIESGKEAEVLILYPGMLKYVTCKRDIIRTNSNLATLKPLGPEGRTYLVEPLFYESFGRLDEIATELAAILHPELFPDYKLVFFRELPL